MLEMWPTSAKSDCPTFQIAFGRAGDIRAISLNLVLSGWASALYLDFRGSTNTIGNARQRLAEKKRGS